jgi:hypothetical protein
VQALDGKFVSIKFRTLRVFNTSGLMLIADTSGMQLEVIQDGVI